LLDEEEPVARGQLMSAYGVFVACSHYVAQFSMKRGREFAIPGFLCDASWVRKNKVKSAGIYWPHALNANGIVNDLEGGMEGRGISATPYHGWIKASWSPEELAEWRAAHDLSQTWWKPWQAAQQDAQGALCHNCSFPYVKYGLGVWFHRDGPETTGSERGFCVNLACPESLFSGYPGPGQLIAECFVRFGMPWEPLFAPPTQADAQLPPALERDQEHAQAVRAFPPPRASWEAGRIRSAPGSSSSCRAA
jgi:hypothetical protein